MPERPLAAITGASSGIGATFARKLAARGYDLLLIARREDRLRSLADELAATHHVSAEPMVADLVYDADVERVADRLQKDSRLALLVNNAGFGTLGFFYEADIGGQKDMHLLHVMATMRLTHAALANMVPHGQGAVINVASVAGFVISPQSVSYCATKAWMNRFTEALAIELSVKKSPVKVQALCPGFTLSEFHDTVGMDRSTIPQSLWMLADFVVEESLRGLDAGKLFVIPGWRYKLIVAATKMLPGVLLRRVYASGGRLRRPKK